jgi:hypothetical protein
MRTGLTALAALAISLPACRDQAARTPAPAALPAPPAQPAAAALESLPADPHRAELHYELAIEPCREAFKCRTVLRLTAAGKVLDVAELWDSGSQQASAEKVDAPWGGGDPLAGAPGARAWATGETDKGIYASTLVRTVRLSAGRLGLLATQRYGWDHVKQRHRLLVNDGNKLSVAWTGEASGRPGWSSTQVVPGPDGTDAIIMVAGDTNEGAPDALAVLRLGWDQKAGRVVPAPVTGLHYAVFGTFADLTKARAAQQKLGECLGLWVLAGRQVPRAGGKFVLATVTTDAGSARRVAQDVQRCAPIPPPRMLEFR